MLNVRFVILKCYFKYKQNVNMHQAFLNHKSLKELVIMLHVTPHFSINNYLLLLQEQAVGEALAVL